jgi:DNA-binding beta-propeller fold protein YncE
MSSSRSRHLLMQAGLAAVVAALIMNARAGERPLAAQERGPQAPIFEIDPLWPKPLPNHWVLGSLGGITVDDQDHIWVLNRGSRTLADNFKQLEKNPPWAICCGSAPAVLEFDQAGNLLRKWGGFPGGPGYEWFDQEHGLAIDTKGNVWIGGGAGGDSHLLKFTKDGTFVKQFGKRNARLVSGDPNGPMNQRNYKANSQDTESLGRPAKMVIEPKTNEVYIADGYLNTRVAVLDADTGKMKRFWGAYGNKPDDSVFEKASVTGDQSATGYDPKAPPAQQFRHAVHCVMVSKDDLVYVCDRQNNRVQVFTKEGKFLKETYILKDTRNAGAVWDIAFSADPQQTFMYVGDGENELIHILRRDTLEELTAFGDGGRQPGQFYGVHVIATDSRGNLYTAETYEGHRVQRFVYKGLGPVTKKYQGVLWPTSAK